MQHVRIGDGVRSVGQAARPPATGRCDPGSVLWTAIRQRILQQILPLACGWLLTLTASGHPISVTSTFVFVSRETVTARIDVFVEDLFLFHNLQPNDRDFLEPDVIRGGIERHKQFLQDRFMIRDVSGQPLQGRVVRVEQPEMDAEGIRLADLMAYQLTFELEYPLDAPPEFLTFSQRLVDEQSLIPAEMQLRVKQEGAGTPYHEVLYPNQPATIRFSWEHPPLSADASQDEWDVWYDRQKTETLGITSYSSVYSFLYIEDYEVRHEILVPLLTLEDSVLISRADGNFLDVAEQDAAAEQITAYFTAGNPVEIDGIVVPPRVDRVDFYGLDFKDFARRAQRQRVSMASARVGLILSYPTPRPPERVRLVWDRFNQYIWSVSTLVYAYDASTRVTLSRVGNENAYEWRSPGREPPPPIRPVPVRLPPRPTWTLSVLSLACLVPLPIVLYWMKRRRIRWQNAIFVTALLICLAAAAWPFARVEMPRPFAPAPEIQPDVARSLVAELLERTYQAFERHDEHDIYDRLACSVDGPLLRELYLQIRRGLQMQEQGGAVARVREVRLQEGTLVSADSPPVSHEGRFVMDGHWTVAGTVEHWGHIHRRTNAYRARLGVEPRDGAWKLVSLDVLEERRVGFETALRGL